MRCVSFEGETKTVLYERSSRIYVRASGLHDDFHRARLIARLQNYVCNEMYFHGGDTDYSLCIMRKKLGNI